MNLLAAAVARLRSLGEAVPVLEPEHARAPIEAGVPDGLGRPTAARQGVAHYLAAHPGGYVQLDPPDGVGTRAGGAVGLYFVNVAAVATTRQAAEALALRAAAALVGAGPASPTPFRVVLPPSSGEAVVGGGGWRCAFAVSYTLNLGRNT